MLTTLNKWERGGWRIYKQYDADHEEDWVYVIKYLPTNYTIQTIIMPPYVKGPKFVILEKAFVPLYVIDALSDLVAEEIKHWGEL